MPNLNGSPLLGPHPQVDGTSRMVPATNNFTAAATTTATAGSGSPEKSDSSPPKSGAATPLAVNTSRQQRSGSSQPPSPAAPQTPTGTVAVSAVALTTNPSPSRRVRLSRHPTANSFGGQQALTPSGISGVSFFAPHNPAAAAAPAAPTDDVKAAPYRADDKSTEPALAVVDIADSERPASPPQASGPAAPGGPSTSPAANPQPVEGQTASPSGVAVEMTALTLKPPAADHKDETAAHKDETAEQMMARLKEELATPSSAPQMPALNIQKAADESFIPLTQRDARFWLIQIGLLLATIASAYGLYHFTATDEELDNSTPIVLFGNATAHLLRMFFANLGRVTPDGLKPHRVGDHLVQHHIFANVIAGGLAIQSAFAGYFTRDQWLFSYVLYSLTFGWNLNANFHNIYSRVTNFNAAERRLTTLEDKRRASDLTGTTRQRRNSAMVNYHLPKINTEHPTWQQRWQALKQDRSYLGELTLTGIGGLVLFFTGRNAIPAAVLYNIVAAFVADLGLVLTGYPVGRATERVTSPEDPYRPVVNASIRISFFLGIDSSLNGALGISRLLILGALLGYYGSATATTRRAHHQRMEHTENLFRQYYPQVMDDTENPNSELTTNLAAIVTVMKQNVEKWLANPTNNILYNPDQRPIGQRANRGLHALIATILVASGGSAILRGDWATLITNTLAGLFAVGTYHLLKKYELTPYEDYRLRNVKFDFKYTVRYGFNYIFRHNPMASLAVPYDWLVGSWDRTIGSDNPAERSFGLNWVNGILVVTTCTEAGGAYSYTYMQPHPSSSELLQLYTFITNPDTPLELNIHTQRCLVEILNSHFPESSITDAIKAKITWFREEKVRTPPGGVPHNPDLLKQAAMGSTAATDSARGLGISRRAGPRFIPAPS